MKILKSSIALLSLALSVNSFAVSNDYDSGAYEEGGNILVKIRGCGILTHGKSEKLPAATSGNTKKNPDMLRNGYGAENANTLFFSDRFATELSVGIGSYIMPNASLADIYSNYGNILATPNTKKRLLIGIPMNLTFQYHMAPYGAIRPYVGAGYNYTYFTSRGSAYKMGSGHGLVLQCGVDFVMTDDTLISLDVKRTSLEPKITYKSSFLNSNQAVSSKIKINPITISLGLGFKL